ncbi:MAG: hypothetical protein IH602_07910 [Bryobacteraceae bacterium]|nr:hypothetical protein [Bryobacteraceae bacterium]
MRRARQAILDWLEAHKPALVDRATAEAIRRDVGEVSGQTFRHTLIESGYALDPLVEGVNQTTIGDLARTLLALEARYEGAGPSERAEMRAMVMESKRHARFAAANRKLDEARRQEKEEMLLWISTWIENPPLFAGWLNLRLAKRAAGSGADQAE